MKNTDTARKYLIEFADKHFNDKSFGQYIQNKLAGDFAYQMTISLQNIISNLPSLQEIEEKCDYVAMKDGYDITGGITADFTDGFIKGSLWMKEVVEDKLI